jgi:hypothetical protein
MAIGPFIEIVNQKKYVLRVESFAMYNTYESWLEWGPTHLPAKFFYEENKRAVEFIKSKLNRKSFDYQKVYFKEPIELELKRYKLKPVYFVCELVSYSPIREKKGAFQLTYAWLANMPYDHTIKELLQKELENIDWENLAEPIDY